ncbi:MAG: DUF2520 domain-containing protein [Bacteroidales bacterium]|nr:DUF2520 domain-containing protein [Bacteroidales bacterium]
MMGAGNVSTHISRHFHSAGHRISCIYSRTEESARRLAGELGVPGTSEMEEVPREADFYILAVSDRAVAGLCRKFGHTRGIWLHTAGSLPMNLFQGIFEQYGVLYPLQTLSRSRSLEPARIPCLVEGSSPEVSEKVKKLASSVYQSVEEVDSPKRLVIHAAAVFANNFTNHMVHIARQLIRAQKLDPGLLDPLVKETFEKIIALGALEAQTGPAVRGDRETMNKHIELLKDLPEWQKLYTFMSREIGRSRDQEDSDFFYLHDKF